MTSRSLAVLWVTGLMVACQGEAPAELDVATIEISIPDGPACSSCTIGVEDVLRLEDAPDAPIPTSPTDVVEDAQGRLWLVFLNNLPLVYEADGRFLRELGPRGQGPGEYQYPTMVHPLPGDSVLVFDRSGSRFYVLGPEFLPVRSIRTNRGYGGASVVVMAWPDSVVLSSTVPATPGTDHSYGIVDLTEPDAALLRSFGSADSDVPIGSNPFFRYLAPATDDQIWTWRWFPYRVERWSLRGDRTAVIELRSSWFPTPYPRLWLLEGEPPPPQVRTVHEDADGRLWVFIDVAAPTWREGIHLPEMPPSGPVEIRDQDVSFERIYQTVVKVLDLEEGRMITETQIAGWVVSALSGYRAAIYDTSADGTPFIRIIRLTLTE